MQILRFSRFTAPLAIAVATAVATAESPIQVTYSVPTADRWNYPFNPTPGIRATASVFGNEPGSPLFDNRDGQMIVAWSTAGDIPTGLALDAYQVLSVRVTVEFATDLALAYDPTVDGWQTFLPPSDPNFVEDDDAGQPVELFGTGFRNGFSLATWIETSPYAPPGVSLLLPGIRNAYALGFENGEAVDVSSHVREQFTPTPFAVGTIEGLKPGELIPLGSRMTLDVNFGDPQVLEYVREGLQAGTLNFTIASLAKVVEQGAVFPAFYCKESPLVQGGFASAATLEVVVAIDSGCGAGDFDCDGSVGPADLAQLLGAWGTTEAIFDLDGDGAVGASDLAVLLGLWG